MEKLKQILISLRDKGQERIDINMILSLIETFSEIKVDDIKVIYNKDNLSLGDEVICLSKHGGCKNLTINKTYCVIDKKAGEYNSVYIKNDKGMKYALRLHEGQWGIKTNI